jgi:hypothetical protein
MAWTLKNRLNRWCLRTLQSNTGSLLHNLIHVQAGMGLLQHNRCKGRPPLQNACIGDYCERWVSIDAEQGFCELRQTLKEGIKSSSD